MTLNLASGESRSLVSNVSLEVGPGECLGIVGETGSGKSTSILAALGLVADPHIQVTSRQRILAGEDMNLLNGRQVRRLRGTKVGIVFQNPLTSLNPSFTIGTQIVETIRGNLGWNRKRAESRAVELLSEMGISDATRRLRQYPYEFSGGMCQRVMLAIALSCKPLLLVADEPTSALDVTIQAQLIELLRSLRDEYGLAVIIVSHDLGVVAEIADRVQVMYAGRIAETATAHDIFEAPRHPYTRALLDCAVLDLASRGRAPMSFIPGAPVRAGEQGRGCAFRARCSRADGLCEEQPQLGAPGAAWGHKYACWHPMPVASPDTDTSLGGALSNDGS